LFQSGSELILNLPSLGLIRFGQQTRRFKLKGIVSLQFGILQIHAIDFFHAFGAIKSLQRTAN
jgi:hypothetical protein